MSAIVDKIRPHDPRISHEYATLNGRRYHYLLAVPQDGHYKATIFLIHGWPDLSLGWRYQIPFLLGQGLRVVAPDMMGYGGTDAPQVPPENIHLYGAKRAADDVADLAKQLSAGTIILGGHDWGGMVVYRIAEWYPKLVSHVFSVCTPYWEPSKQWVSTEDLTKGPSPQLAYQLHLAGSEVETHVQGRTMISNFLKGMYGGKPEHGQQVFDPYSGININALKNVGMCPLMNEEELEYYTSQYLRNGMHGPLNWYRVRRANYEDELHLKSKGVEQPVLYIAALKDNVLTPEMSKGMEKHIPKLSRAEVNSGHWALTQTPKEVNAHVKHWLDTIVFGSKLKSVL